MRLQFSTIKHNQRVPNNNSIKSESFQPSPSAVAFFWLSAV